MPDTFSPVTDADPEDLKGTCHLAGAFYYTMQAEKCQHVADKSPFRAI